MLTLYLHLFPLQVDGMIYADDILLFTDTRRKMKGIINMDEKIKKMEMEVNAGKTNYIIINQKTPTESGNNL